MADRYGFGGTLGGTADLADGNGRLGPYQAAAYMQRALRSPGDNIRVVSLSGLVDRLMRTR